ncbi:MAG: hypothetical protein SO129_05075, partial [Anaerovibrio sp.]|nr:hypothetical protein [Anaerovibrio sp.]
MAPHSTEDELKNVIDKIEEKGLGVHLSKGASRT